MEHVKKIVVSIKFADNEIEVGELVSEGGRIYFKYHIDFVKKGLELSPLKLKLNSGLQIADAQPFDGLFGIFADSLPDGWGRLVLDKTLSFKGLNVNSLTLLDRLAYAGSTGMGALIYRPAIETEKQKSFLIDLDKISKATNQIVNGKASDLIDNLFKLAGFSGGDRPKILVGYNSKTKHLIDVDENLPKGYAHWMIKFSSDTDRPDCANIEYAYYKMAKDSGIEMSDSRLFKGKSGKVYFGTKRFDRDGNKRLHLHSAAGMLHDNSRLGTMDYGNLMDCAFILEKDVRAYDKILRLAAFNVFANNRNDHSKNFSFLMDEGGIWRVAPAYDLTFSNSVHGMYSTKVAGESANPTKKHLMELANYFRIKKATAIIDEVKDVVLNWKKYAKEAGVEKESRKMIDKVIGKFK